MKSEIMCDPAAIEHCRDQYVSMLVSTLPPTSEPSLLGPSLSQASYHKPPILDCASFILDYTGFIW